MRKQHCVWNGVVSIIYHLSIGEEIARHYHHVDHVTIVIQGQSLVTVGDMQFAMTPDMEAYVLPAEVRHTIIALENNTIVMNTIDEGAMAFIDDEPRPHAGVLLHDGTFEER